MNEAPETRPSLLVRLRDARDREAWGQFVEIYEPLIYRLARTKGFQHADASDVTQDVLATVGNAIDRFDPDPGKGSFRGWLNRIARNLMINFLARQKGPQGTGDTATQLLLDEHPAPEPEAVSLFELEYRRQLFRVAVERVRPRFTETTWQAFWLTGVEGQSIDSVARRLTKSCGAIRIARCRVLACLKREISQISEES